MTEKPENIVTVRTLRHPGSVAPDQPEKRTQSKIRVPADTREDAQRFIL